MSNKFAPIALFVYKRPKHAKLTIEYLIKNPEFAESVLHVFSDGPKKAEDVPLVEEVRRAISGYDLPNLVLHEQSRNLGLANSIIQGVATLCKEYGRVIVLEDDLLVAHGFLSYMNRALKKYETEEKVMQICGHVFPFSKAEDASDAFFLPITNTYGWATWERAWRFLDLKCTGYEMLKTDKEMCRRFNLNSAYPYSKMLFACMAGKIDVWAIKWWWSVFQLDGLCLYPQYSLVKNIGFGVTSTNTKASDTYINDLHWSANRLVSHLPDKIESSNINYKLLEKYIALHYASPIARIKRQLTKLRNLVIARF